MTERFWLERRLRGREYVLQLHGALDGSTACRVLEAVHLAPPNARELVLDLTRLSRIEVFGLEILQRGVRGCARGRPIRFEGGALVA
jgi:anti-anti-sigma regulatory factor